MATVKTLFFIIIIYVLILQTLQHGSSFPHLSSLIVLEGTIHVSDIFRFQSQKAITASSDLLLYTGQRTLGGEAQNSKYQSYLVTCTQSNPFFSLTPKICKLDQMLWRLPETWTAPTLASQFGSECNFEGNILIVPIYLDLVCIAQWPQGIQTGFFLN